MEVIMSPEKLVLLIIQRAGAEGLKGKTLLQKRAYFLDKILNLGLGFRAHYYGPYSPMLEEGLAKAKTLGFIQENPIGFETINESESEYRRYDYKLTQDGQKVVEFMQDKYSKETENVLKGLQKLNEAGDVGDYMSLSIAAKTHHILSQLNKKMKVSEIESASTKLGWNITPEQIKNAVNFLKNMKLAKTV